MVPDKFNMVDMGGIDLITVQGEEVPGLYSRLVESIAQCRYQCLYNWFFNGIIIPPTYVKMEVNDNEEVVINEGVTVTDEDIIHIYSIEIPAEIIPLLAEENGVYNVPAGKDGFNPVTVDVPSYTPVIEPITITENGTYNVPTGVDGYGPVTVDVAGGSVGIAVADNPNNASGFMGPFINNEETTFICLYADNNTTDITVGGITYSREASDVFINNGWGGNLCLGFIGETDNYNVSLSPGDYGNASFEILALSGEYATKLRGTYVSTSGSPSITIHVPVNIASGYIGVLVCANSNISSISGTLNGSPFIASLFKQRYGFSSFYIVQKIENILSESDIALNITESGSFIAMMGILGN